MSEQADYLDELDLPTFAPRHEHAASCGEPLPAAVADALAALNEPASLTVLVNDPQRHTATPAVLAELARHMAPQAIRLLVSTGTHHIDPGERPTFERRLLGGQPFGEIHWHDARAENLADIGGVWRGHPWLREGRPLLAIGSVEPHYFAGFTGAHKTATIGCASYADIEANHAAALSPDCRPGRLDGNPVHEGICTMLDALERSAPLAAVNLVQAGSDLLAAFGGIVRDTLADAAAVAADAFIHTLEAPADALVLEVTGPLARSFYQADKGIKNNEWAVADGGCLVLLADCPAGVGQDHFFQLLREAPTHERALQIVADRGYRLGDHKAVRLRHLTDPVGRGVMVMLVSDGISAEEARTLGMIKTASPAQALSAAGVEPGLQKVYRVRDAGNCVLTLRRH